MKNMKLPFEDWIEKQTIPMAATGLFDEAIVCYKASAYRASLLFSFLGLQTIIKYRVLEAKKPDHYHEKAWEDIRNKLSKDEKWDEEVNECVKKSDNNKIIFNISHDLRNQFEYWKNRRNDCAHSKDNAISYSHVESFWLFMQSNLAKFAVKGSMETLLEKIERHFDRSYTPSDKDFNYILEEIPYAVNKDNLVNLFTHVRNIFDQKAKQYDIFGDVYSVMRFHQFWYELFNLDGDIAEKLVGFFKQPNNEKLFTSFVARIPKGLLYFKDDHQFIRNLWFGKLKYNNMKYKILSTMLRNNLIPDEQREEAYSTLIHDANGAYIEEEDFYILKEHGFFEKFREMVFFDGYLPTFNWVNNNTELVTLYLNKIELDNDVVRNIIDMFSGLHFPYRLRDVLVENFSNHPSIREKFIGISREIGCALPENLGFSEGVQQV